MIHHIETVRSKPLSNSLTLLMLALFGLTICIQTSLAQNLSTGVQASVTLSMDASKSLNKFADQVGIWVNTTQDIDNQNFMMRLRDLKIKMIRYGWQGGIFEKNNLDTQEQSPRDDANQVWLTANGRINERFGPQRLAALLSTLEIDANSVVSIDGINYTGHQDAVISAMTQQERIDFYVGRLVDWVKWNKSEGHRFNWFEIGNESDIEIPLSNGGAGTCWTASDYGNVANQAAIKATTADPNTKIGINGGMLGDADIVKWFDGIYAAAPNINDNISFVATHKYESWLDFTTWSAHADWAFGKTSAGVLTSCKNHFPTKPILVTEFGSWKNPGENLTHYRACLNVEMFGNVFSDPQIAMVQQWPSKWGDGVFYQNDDYVLTPMGLALKAYTKFCLPVMASNGNKNGIRYFLATDPATKATIVWMINHLKTEQSVNCSILNFSASSTNEQWRLTAPGNDPFSTSSTLNLDAPVALNTNGTTATFTTTLPPVSVTIVAFGGNISAISETLKPEKFQLSLDPVPATDLLNVSFLIPNNSDVEIAILNLSGNVVLNRNIEYFSTGKHAVQLNVENLTNGTYFVRVSGNGISATEKMVKIGK